MMEPSPTEPSHDIEADDDVIESHDSVSNTSSEEDGHGSERRRGKKKKYMGIQENDDMSESQSDGQRIENLGGASQ